MKWGSLIVRFIASLLGVGILLVLLLGALMGADVSIPVSPMRQSFIEAASRVLGREIQVDGEIRMTLSYFPELVVNDIRIPNNGKWQAANFVHADKARVRLALRPILEGRLEFSDIIVDGINASFEQRSGGEKNWLSNEEDASGAGNNTDDTGGNDRAINDIRIDHFKLSNIRLSYHDQALGKNYNSRLDQVRIDTLNDSQLQIDFSGERDDIAYQFSARAGLLRELLRGEPWALEGSGDIGGQPLVLRLNTRTEGDLLEGAFQLKAKQVNVGELLDKFNIIEGLNFSTDALSIDASLKGYSLENIFEHSTFKLLMNEGSWRPAQQLDFQLEELRLRRAEIVAIQSQDISVKFEGDIDGEPLKIDFHSNALDEYIRGLESARLRLKADFADTDMDFQGEVKLPISAQTISLDMQVSGQRLDTWNNFLKEELPPYGPFQLNGQFNIHPDGFRLTEFRSIIGQSQLGGTVNIDTTGARPVWKMDLISELFQLNDFVVDGYSFIPGEGEGGAGAAQTGESRKAEFRSQMDQSLSEVYVIDQWDIDINLRSEKVLSGDDLLGDGVLHLSTRQDRFDEKFELNTPTSHIEGEIGFRKVLQGLEGVFKLDMDHFDYGVFLRRLDPENQTDGLISARVDLKLAGKDYSHSFEQANGKIDFVVWPKNIDADVMDIWAINVFFAIFPPLTDEKSKVNCLVSLLNLDDGNMQEEFFAVDSTKVWLDGNLSVDFKQQSIALILKPNAKRPRIFGIETPIQIKGDFDEQEVGIAPGGIAGSAVSFIFSPLHVPLRRLFEKEIPADVSETCGKMLDREYLKTILAKMPKLPEKQWY